MKVSVVLCTYSTDRHEDYVEAVESALGQAHEPVEVVLVVDGNEEVFERVEDRFGDHDRVILHCNDENRGISHSRTKGAELASGDVVAFLDDDAVAAPDWVEELVGVYESTDAVAVGGRLAGEWVVGEPSFLPEEFYWLVGVTPRGFADHMEEVRNTYGSNLSFRRGVFLEAGGFDENTGLKADSKVQAHEAPVCLRVRENTGNGVVYNDNAVVYHKIFDYRTDPWWLLDRAFWQGYSKHVMERVLKTDDDGKRTYLKQLMLEFVPRRAAGLVRSPSAVAFVQLVMIFVLTGTVGLGYLYGKAQPDEAFLEDLETAGER
jgi:glycosyltransferase involved in cell wall biosynthesis